MYKILMPYTYVKSERVREHLDGYELLLITAGILKPNWNIDRKMVDFYKKLEVSCWRFHACYSTPPQKFKHLTMNLAEKPNKQIEKALKNQISIASAISGEEKPNLIVIHSGSVKNIEERENGIENVVENLKKALDTAEEEEITLALETKERRVKGDLYFIGSQYQDLIEIKKEVGSDLVKFTCDIGHLKTMGGTPYIKEAIRRLGKNIIHAHIHWNDSRLDLHQPLTAIPEEEKQEFKTIIKLLIEKTDIPNEKYRTFTLEIAHKTIAKPPKHGATTKEQIESIKILKNLIEKQ